MSNTFTRDPSPRIQYGGDGGRTSFPFPFAVLASDDLLVFVDAQPATGFAISGLGQPNGEITFVEPPATGTTVTLLRRTEGIRETAFVDGGPFRAAAINAELDRIMLLIQENREEHNRALRALSFEGDLDYCLPPVAQRANSLLGFDSAGRPMVFGQAELPSSGDGSGLLVTPSGTTQARALGEHLATIINVRDFGAIGDGVSDDTAAFQAALAAAQTRSSPVHVPASATPYVLGAGLVLDGVGLIGDGPGSTLKLTLAGGFGLQLTGDGSRLARLRLLGPGANVWPAGASEVDLGGVALDGVRIATDARDAVLHSVEIAACHTGLAIAGPIKAAIDCSFMFCRNGVEVRAGATGSIVMARASLKACTYGFRADAGALFERATLAGGDASLCGRAIELAGPSTGWRIVEVSDLHLPDNLDDMTIGPRHSVGVRGCYMNPAGKRAGVGIALSASGETIEAPNLVVENTRADVIRIVTVQLSGGTNLDLMQPGDLVVLANDTDEVDDLWTALKATRAGIVHRVVSQTISTAEIELAAAAAQPLVQATDVIRVAGRSGTASVDSVGSSVPTTEFAWLRVDDYCRVFAAHNPMPAHQITLVGGNSDLRHFPGLSDEPVALSRVELAQGAVNGALTRLVTLEIAQDTAVSFTPDSPIGMVQVFGHAASGDPSAAIFTYRAEPLGYTELVAGNIDTVAVLQGTALTGTSGEVDQFTFSAHTDGKIYVENRLVGAPRKLSLFVVGAQL